MSTIDALLSFGIQTNEFRKILSVSEIGDREEEMIETTAWDDEPVCYPDTEETREAFKDVFNIPIFRHLVYDKDGNIEMEIFYERDARPYSFSVIFPRFTNSNAKIRDCAHLYGFMWEQIGMLIYAYSEEEYWKFEKAFCEWSGRLNDKSDN